MCLQHDLTKTGERGDFRLVFNVLNKTVTLRNVRLIDETLYISNLSKSVYMHICNFLLDTNRRNVANEESEKIINH